MNHSKLLKSAKSLNKFSFDDLVIISELSEQAVQLFIDESLKNGTIKKSKTNGYLFANCTRRQDTSLEIKPIWPSKLNRVQTLMKTNNQKIDYEIFMHISKQKKEKAVKSLILFKALENVKNKKVKSFVLEWGEKYPQYKIAYSSFLRKVKEYEKYGIIGLISEQKNYEKTMALIPGKVLKRFKQLYLSQEDISADKCFEIIKSENKKIILPLNYIPFFLTKLRNELKDSTIAYYKTLPCEIAEFIKITESNKKANKKESEKNQLETFYEATVAFLESEYCKKIDFIVYKSYKNSIKSNLIPFFGKIKLKNINADKINQFIEIKINDGFSVNSINRYLSLLRSILSLYGTEAIVSESIKELKSNTLGNDLQLLNEIEIKKLLTSTKKYYPKFYPMLLIALTTGITLGEILALKWDDIDFQKNILKINRSVYKNKIITYGKANLIRELYIIPEVIKILTAMQENNLVSKENLVFPNLKGEIQCPESIINKDFNPTIEKAKIKEIKFVNLRDIYASLLIKQKLPLTYIQKQLGHSSLNTTAERYKSLIDESKVEISKIFETFL